MRLRDDVPVVTRIDLPGGVILQIFKPSIVQIAACHRRLPDNIGLVITVVITGADNVPALDPDEMPAAPLAVGRNVVTGVGPSADAGMPVLALCHKDVVVAVPSVEVAGAP